MSGGDDRQSAAQLSAALLGQGEELLVVVLDGLLQGQLLVRRALAGLALQYVPRADEGDGAEDGARLAGMAPEHQHLLLQGIAHRRHHPGIQLRQQGAALAEHRHRIMVAAQHHQPGARGAQLDDELVVLLAGITGRRAGVEHVAGDQHHIHLAFAHLLDQPAAEGLVLGLPGLAHEVLAQVPVGCVEDAHRISLWRNGNARNPVISWEAWQPPSRYPCTHKMQIGNFMQRILRDIKIMLLANLWLIPVMAALVGALFYFVAPPPPMHARLATGSPTGGYSAFGEKLKAELAKQGFELELVSSSGSLDNLAKLQTGEAEIALVQSGQELTLSNNERRHLHGLGVMFQEPVWLFKRKDLTIDSMADLLPLRVAIGAPDSGTRSVSDAILGANQITPERYPPQWQAISGSRAASALIDGELEAGFFLGPAENAVVQRLAAQPELDLISLRRSAAYRARLPYLTKLEVGEGLLNLASNSPSQDIRTLAPVATLVASDDFHPSLTPLILDAAREVMKNGSLLDPPGAYPSAKPQTLRTLDEADYFYEKGLPILQRYLPFRIASLADRYIILLIPLIVIMIPLSKVVGPIYRWRIRARIYRWYKYLREIDRKLDSGTPPDHLSAEIEHLEKLEQKLAKVEVPLSYSNELYDLHMHLRYVINRLQAVQSRQAVEDQVG
ncbi:TRAP transporter solute receptor, TAXI family [compost metagenome]